MSELDDRPSIHESPRMPRSEPIQLRLSLTPEIPATHVAKRGRGSGGHGRQFAVATWNVNSVRARLELLGQWLQAIQPDVVCLQETKVSDDQFPADEFARLGYRVAFHGQRRYNGVAILSRQALDRVQAGIGRGVESEARVLAASVRGIRVVNVYAPNAQSPTHETFTHKVQWLSQLARYVRKLREEYPQVLLCGDFNVAPRDADVHDRSVWLYQTFIHPDARAALKRVTTDHFIDLHVASKGNALSYTWWDYRGDAVVRNHGMRIDHVYATRQLAGRCTDVVVDLEARRAHRPSDHAPLVACFDLGYPD